MIIFDLRILGDEAASALSTFRADVMVLIIGALAALVTLIYMRNRIGYALTALREDEDAAKVMGINVTRYKIIAFITSACFAGLVGAMFGSLSGKVSADQSLRIADGIIKRIGLAPHAHKPAGRLTPAIDQ